eukprot:9082739-Ditylum_brightwellii.AAC.1
MEGKVLEDAFYVQLDGNVGVWDCCKKVVTAVVAVAAILSSFAWMNAVELMDVPTIVVSVMGKSRRD